MKQKMHMKKVLTFLLALGMLLVFAACSSENKGKNTLRINIYNMDNELRAYSEYQPEPSEEYATTWKSYEKNTESGSFDFIGSYVVYEDIFNRENSVAFLDESGTQLGFITYQYDKNGRKTKEIISKYNENNAKGVAFGIYHYDDGGKHIKTEIYDSSEKLIVYFVNEYGNDGSFIRKVRYDASGNAQDYSDKAPDIY